MSASSGYRCTDCPHIAPSLPAARRHSREAGPVWRPARQTHTGHILERVKPEGAA